MEPFGKGNGQASPFKAEPGARIPKLPVPLRSSPTPPPLSRPQTVPHTPSRSPSAVAETSPAPSSPSHEAPRRFDDDYGVRRAIELLRKLPSGERGVLVEVVRMTLESVNVHVTAIINDANNREADIDRRIGVLQGEVKQRKEEISTREDEIANLQMEQKEISRVRQELSTAHEQAALPSAPKTLPENDAASGEDDPGEVTVAITTT